MNEEQFRKRFRGALGDPPPGDTRSQLERNLTAARSSRSLSRMGAVVATMALLVVASAVGWRLVYQRTTSPAVVTGSAPPTALPTVSAVDPLNCRLPVIVLRESGSPGQLVTEPGFVDTRSGQYVTDTAASIEGLPGGAFVGYDIKPSRPAAPVWYSAAAKRWLPVGQREVAQDGRSYLWVRLLPDGSNNQNFRKSELHRYDLTTATDHVLWTYAGSINVHRWDGGGILLDTVPPTGGTMILWRIDPQTGAASQQPNDNRLGELTLLPGEGKNGGFSYGSNGTDAQGRTIYRIGSRAAGDQEWVFYESAPGQRVTIYKGRQGDATGFDPMQPMGEGLGIWFGDYETRGLWYWDPASGLHKISVTGLPTGLSGPNSGLYVNPAGSCT
jgi:hypothetical protein